MGTQRGFALGLTVLVWCCGLSAVGAEEPSGLGEPIEIHRRLPTDVWPQVQNTPQRTGYSPVQIELPVEEKWQVRLSDMDVGNQIQRTVQPIVAEGRVYLGCRNGRFFALDAGTGEVMWRYDAGGAVWHTAGYSKGKVFFAALDGCVYALDAGSGEEAWVFDNGRRHGFSTAVLLAEDHVFAVDRGGVLFCLDPEQGREVWHYDAGAPVLQCPAYSNGRVFFADEDMRVHAVKADDGTRSWLSETLEGWTFQYYWPVVVHGVVIVRSECYTEEAWNPTIYEGAWKEPGRRSLFLLDEDTGDLLPVVEHYHIGVHQGPPAPPAVTRDGLLVMRWSGGYLDPEKKYVVSGGPRGTTTSPWQGHIWVLQDIREDGKVVTLLEPDYVPGSKKPWIAVGLGPPDETTINSVLGDLVTSIISMGWREYGPGGQGLLKTGYSRAHGLYGLDDRRWHWEGLSEAGEWANQFAGGVAAVSAADGLVYNTSWNTVQCHGPAR
jgi:outer membrane protein assembly factor BamB